MKFFILIIFTSFFGFYNSADHSIKLNMGEAKDLIPPPEGLENFTLGLKPQMADSLWVRSIQDFDYCEQEIAKLKCKGNTWLYHMLDTVTNLDPEFRMPFALGALSLSVIINDLEGATKLFDKADKYYPNDWKIMYRGGYHALLEEHNIEKAARRFEAAARNGAPSWILGLSGRLYNEAGRKEAAERLVQELSSSEKDSWIGERLKKRMAERAAEEAKNLKK